MSGLYPNSLTLYLRPLDALQPYTINNCARWLVLNKKFKDFISARLWLQYQEDNHPFNFKAIMSHYFDVNDYKADYKSKRNVDLYHTSVGGEYGEEFMGWTMG